MKWIIILLAILLIPSCAKRPENIDGKEEEQKTETAEYKEPPKTYRDELAENLGYAIHPDSIHCYTAPIFEYSPVHWSEIEFSPMEQDGRYTYWNDIYTEEVSYFDKNYVFGHPYCVFLLSPDGNQMKLCPYEDCRNDPALLCEHLFIPDYSPVYDGYVYFAAENVCIAAPDHPSRAEVDGMVHMLLRYDIEKHEIEKVMDIPDCVSVCGIYYGVLVMNVHDESGSGVESYMIMELETGKIAPVRYINDWETEEERIFITRLHNMRWADRYEKDCWYSGGYDSSDGSYTVKRVKYDLSEESEFIRAIIPDELTGPPKTIGGESFWPSMNLAAVGDDCIYIMRSEYTDDPSSKPDMEIRSGGIYPPQKHALYSLDRSGNTVKLLDNIGQYVVTDKYLFVTEYRPRHLFTTPLLPNSENSHLFAGEYYPDCAQYHAAWDSTVYAYPRREDGTIQIGESKRKVWFTEGEDTTFPDEYIWDIRPAGDILEVSTVRPFDTSEDSPDEEYFFGYNYIRRTYLVNEDGADPMYENIVVRIK